MIKKLISHIGQYKKAAILAPSLVVLEVLCQLLLPVLQARIIDVGIEGGAGVGYIVRTGALMVGLTALAMLLGASSARYAAISGQGFGANLRQAMFDRIQEFSFADIDRFSSASLITRVTNDIATIQMMVSVGLRLLARAPLVLITALIVCVILNAKLSLVLFGVGLLMGIFILLMLKVVGKYFRRFQERIDGLNDAVQENLIAIRVVKAFVRADHEKEKFREANDELTRAGLAAISRVILLQPLMSICMSLATMGVLWFGGGMVIRSEMPVGELSSFINYIAQVLMSVMMLAMVLFQVTRAQACAKRVVEVLDTVPDIVDGADPNADLPAPQGKIELRDVSFKYLASGTGDDVLSHIDLTIEPGAFVALVGGTGVGKSSLVNLIPRFYDVTGGAVLVDGMDVRDYPIEALRGRIGMVLQNNVLFSGTIRENLLWGKEDATEAELVAAAQAAQAYDFIMATPDGFDTWLEQGGVNVSGGQKQRLCIARALLRKPAILILDDSTSAVDSGTEAKIRAHFRSDFPDTTILIIAQRVSSVQYADKIVVLDDDHIVGMGTHDELLAGNAIYQEIYQSQQEGVSA